jgi:hypothetical protein
MQPFFGPMPAAEYHAHRAISRGCLTAFRENRRECWQRWFSPNRVRKEANDAMRFGTLVHDCMLEPEMVRSKHVVKIEALELPQTFGRDVWSQSDFSRARDCAASAMLAVQPLLTSPAKREWAIIWRDEETGLDLRCRPDWLIDAGDSMLCIDLKTCGDASPNGFRQSVKRYGYDIQASHYSNGIRVATGKPVDWYFLAVESEPSRILECNGQPFGEHRAALHEIDVEAGEEEYRKTLHDLAEAIKTDSWAEEWEQGINELSIWRK